MIRAVLDTNVLISALVFEGEANALVGAWQQGRFHLLVSKALLDEYIHVLHYPKFHLSGAPRAEPVAPPNSPVGRNPERAHGQRPWRESKGRDEIRYLVEEELLPYIHPVKETKPKRSVSVCRDPNDNMFLDCALAGHASFIVTGDQDLLVLNPFRGIKIVTPKEFLTLLPSH